MKKKILIVLHGVGNAGKTDVLKKILKLLEQEPQIISIVSKANSHNRTRDINPTKIVLGDKSNKTINIGIASAGDEEKIVRENLKYFNDNNCSIMFCAARTYGETTTPIKEINEASDIIVIPFYKIKYESNYEELNSNLAKEILTIAKLRWNNLTPDQNGFRFNIE